MSTSLPSKGVHGLLAGVPAIRDRHNACRTAKVSIVQAIHACIALGLDQQGVDLHHVTDERRNHMSLQLAHRMCEVQPSLANPKADCTDSF